MNIPVSKKETSLYPDKNKVIARYFYNGDERAREIIMEVINLPADMFQLKQFS